MAIKTIKTVEGNTAPPLTLTATRNKVVINLTGCTVAFIITKGNVVTNAGHQSATITNAASGLVSYVRQAGDLATAGTYICDLQVTYSDGTVEILYDQLKLVARKKAGSTV